VSSVTHRVDQIWAKQLEKLSMSQSTEASVGMAIEAFETAASACGMLEAAAPVKFDDGLGVELTARVYGKRTRECIVKYGDGRPFERFESLSLTEVMKLAGEKFARGKLNILAIKLTAKKHPSLTRGELTKLAIAAWCEAFGIAPATEAQLKELTQAAKASADEDRHWLIEHLRGGAAGLEKWNQLAPQARMQHGALKKVDLSNLDLTHAHLGGSRQDPLDMQGCNFEKSVLIGAKGTHLDASKSNFNHTCNG
jgi:hypothetical protein